MTQYWFKSDLFEIEPDEDDEINSRKYGRQLAHWLKQKLEHHGYDVEPVIAEDWGRCLMVAREPFMLWVGCGNMDSNHRDLVPAGRDIVWTCFTAAEVSLWKRLFKKMDTAPMLNKLETALASILASEPRIQMVEESY